MNKVFTSADQFNKHFFPKSYKEKRIKEMSVEERSKYWVAQIMKGARRILRRGK